MPFALMFMSVLHFVPDQARAAGSRSPGRPDHWGCGG